MKVYNNNCVVLFVIIVVAAVQHTCADYWSDRDALVNSEYADSLGANLFLSQDEKFVDTTILMKRKIEELARGYNDTNYFLPAEHFFTSKPRIEKSEVFQFIKKVPKGASLHSHDLALASNEYVYNLTFSDNLYACQHDDRIKLAFPGGLNDASCKWELVAHLRAANSSFDDFLKTQINIIVDDPYTAYKNVNDAWKKFAATFTTISGMILYKPVFVEYFYQALKELYDDNVFYLEFRTTLPEVYEDSGKVHGPQEVVELYLETSQRFKRDYPTFHGVRLIYAPNRHVSDKIMNEYEELTFKLRSLYPDFVAGFDLVGQEDLGFPLKSFIPELLNMSSYTKFFFHAGETKWNGALPDSNVIDAVLLNTTRIGHGYALMKHPVALKMAKQKNIAIEICPISNQVLDLVHDMRNHPGAILISENYPLVICCDDPGFWGAKALSYDWYMAFMGMASVEANLKFLKQLAINSIIYSAMDSSEKDLALGEWQIQWNSFIASYVNESMTVDDINIEIIL